MGITTRQTTAIGVTNKGAPLTNAELDENFIYLLNGNTRALNVEGNVSLGNSSSDTISLSGSVNSNILSTQINNTIQNFTIPGTSNIITIKNSSTSGVFPASLDLAEGELYLNSQDNKLFYKRGSSVTDLTKFHSSKSDVTLSQGIAGAQSQTAAFWKSKSIHEVLDAILFPSTASALDPRYGPYDSLLSALVAVSVSQRYIGLTVGIINSGSIVEYWFKEGTADGNLVLKTTGGVSGDYIPLNQKGQPNGVATLDVTGKIPTAQLPSVAIANYLGAADNQVEMLTFIGAEGDWCVRVDLGTTWIIIGSDPSQLSNWKELAYPSVPVISVNGEVGAVSLTANHVNAVPITSETGSATIPVGSTAQRDASPQQGYLRFNNTTFQFEGYNGSSWGSIGGGASLSNTSSPDTHYLTFANATSGSFGVAYVADNRLFFQPSTGTLSAMNYSVMSDARQKDNVQKIYNAEEILAQIDGVSFDWKNADGSSYGVIAQELEKVLPILVSTSEDDVKSVNYDGLIPFLIEAVKSLSQRVKVLEATVE